MDGNGRNEESSGGKMSDIEKKITVSAFCRRRLAVMVCRMKMAETVKMVSPSSLYSTRSKNPLLILSPLLHL